jgi:hypothetical protein
MRVIPVVLAALTASAVSSAQAAPNPNLENWLPLGPCSNPSLWVTKAAGTTGIRRSGATGAAIGGGVRACPIDDLVPLGGRLNGLGA